MFPLIYYTVVLLLSINYVSSFFQVQPFIFTDREGEAACHQNSDLTSKIQRYEAVIETMLRNVVFAVDFFRLIISENERGNQVIVGAATK